MLRQQKRDFDLHCVCFCIGLFNQDVLKSKTVPETEKGYCAVSLCISQAQCTEHGFHPPQHCKDQVLTHPKNTSLPCGANSRPSVEVQGVRDQSVCPNLSLGEGFRGRRCGRGLLSVRNNLNPGLAYLVACSACIALVGGYRDE